MGLVEKGSRCLSLGIGGYDRRYHNEFYGFQILSCYCYLIERFDKTVFSEVVDWVSCLRIAWLIVMKGYILRKF